MKTQAPVEAPIELWIGLHHEVDYHAKQAGVLHPTIISRLDQMLGYHGPLIIHFCGNWWKLEDASLIRCRLDDLKECGDKIKTVNH